jgi:hypothetical protein
MQAPPGDPAAGVQEDAGSARQRPRQARSGAAGAAVAAGEEDAAGSSGGAAAQNSAAAADRCEGAALLPHIRLCTRSLAPGQGVLRCWHAGACMGMQGACMHAEHARHVLQATPMLLADIMHALHCISSRYCCFFSRVVLYRPTPRAGGRRTSYTLQQLQ